MSAHFNDLTAAQAERLAFLVEEIGEALHAAGKVLRHGYESSNPMLHDGPTNRVALAEELGHVEAAIQMLKDELDVSAVAIEIARSGKVRDVRRWMHHQRKG